MEKKDDIIIEGKCPMCVKDAVFNAKGITLELLDQLKDNDCKDTVDYALFVSIFNQLEALQTTIEETYGTWDCNDLDEIPDIR